MPTVLITGGSRGIGAAMVRRFYAAGWNVAFSYWQSEQAAQALATQMPGVLSVRADVADSAQVAAMFSAVHAVFPHIDMLVNNAAIAQDGLFLDLTEADWQRVFAVNFFGAVYCTGEAIRDMYPRGRGNILNISSIWGLKGASCESGYASSKAALIGLSRSLAKEWGPSGIRVNCIAPGVIDTDMNAQHSAETMQALAEEIPLGRIGRAEEVASLALYLASPEAEYITGQVFSVDGGWDIT